MLEEFDVLLRDLAAALFSQVQSNLSGRSWTNAILDARYDGQGGYSAKIRAKVGEDSVSIETDLETCEKLIEIDGSRHGLTGEWFGLLVNVDPSGKCGVDFDYDPKCFDSKSFYDD